MLRINKQDLSLNKMIFTCVLMVVNSISEVKSVEYYDKKPDFVPTCKLSQSDFDKCVIMGLQKLMDQLAIGGIPEIVEEFGPFDPLRVRDMNFEQDGQGIAKLRANFSQLTLAGLSKAIIEDNRLNRTDFSWITKMFVPKMRLEGMYKMEGSILSKQLNGAGKMFMEIENATITFFSKLRLVDKYGFTFENITSTRADLNTTQVRSNLENIFEGQSEELQRETNEFFNENWREFFEALKPVVTKTVESAMFDVWYKSFLLIPLNFFIEDIPTAKEFYGL